MDTSKSQSSNRNQVKLESSRYFVDSFRVCKMIASREAPTSRRGWIARIETARRACPRVEGTTLSSHEFERINQSISSSDKIAQPNLTKREEAGSIAKKTLYYFRNLLVRGDDAKSLPADFSFHQFLCGLIREDAKSSREIRR